jgi:hypothetical protein
MVFDSVRKVKEWAAAEAGQKGGQEAEEVGEVELRWELFLRPVFFLWLVSDANTWVFQKKRPSITRRDFPWPYGVC